MHLSKQHVGYIFCITSSNFYNKTSRSQTHALYGDKNGATENGRPELSNTNTRYFNKKHRREIFKFVSIVLKTD